jgi:O-methyltransferase
MNDSQGLTFIRDLVNTVYMKAFVGKVFFRISRVVLGYLGLNISLGVAKSKYPELSAEEMSFLSKVHSQSLTMTSFESLATLAIACKYLSKWNLSSSFVEAGVWRGGSSIVAKRFLGGTREFYLYDTYKGMTKPSNHDYRVGESDGLSTQKKWADEDSGTHNKWVYASLDDVKKNFDDFGLYDPKIHFVEGAVETTLRANKLPSEIILLRLDTDFYESTLVELQVLWPKLLSGGILILDDYGHWDGARRAVDEYFDSIGLDSFFLVPIAGGGGRIGIKK